MRESRKARQKRLKRLIKFEEEGGTLVVVEKIEPLPIEEAREEWAKLKGGKTVWDQRVAHWEKHNVPNSIAKQLASFQIKISPSGRKTSRSRTGHDTALELRERFRVEYSRARSRVEARRGKVRGDLSIIEQIEEEMVRGIAGMGGVVKLVRDLSPDFRRRRR